MLGRRETSLAGEVVANVSQVVTIDDVLLAEPVGQLPARQQPLLLAGLDLMLGG